MSSELQNYAKFDSRVSSANFESYDMARGASFASPSDIFGPVVSLIDLFAVLAIAFLVFSGAVLGLYVLISLVRRGADATLAEMRTLAAGAGRSAAGALSGLAGLLRGIWRWIARHRILSAFVLLLLFAWSFAGGVVDGSSRVLRLTRIPDGYVGVDLVNRQVISSRYHLHSPIFSDVFLAPTNTFDFEIAEVTANTKEDLGVSLDYRVWFHIRKENMLDLYAKFGAKNIQGVSSDIVMPKLLESIKGIVRGYSFRDLSARHEDIKSAAIAQANEALAPMGIEIQELNILDIRLPASYTQSQEELLKAENALKLSEATLERERKEAESAIVAAQSARDVRIIEAEGIAKYNELVNAQGISQQSLELKRLENERAKIDKWNGVLPATLSGGNPF